LGRLPHRAGQRGATLVEYALVLVAIVFVTAGVYRLLGEKVDCVTVTAGKQLVPGGGGKCAGAVAAAGPAGAAGGAGGAANGAGGASPAMMAFASSAGAAGAAGGGPSSGMGASGGGVAYGSLGSSGAGANDTATSFADQTRGQNGEPLDRTLAQLSGNADNRSVAVPAGWSAVSAGQLAAAGINPASLVDPSTDLRSTIYTDGKGNYVLAFGGTNSSQGWKTNLEQGLGMSSGAYDEAAALGKDAKLAYGDHLVITGVSLGGGLASTAALASGTTAVTFDAAGVNDKTLERLGLDPAQARQQAENGQIRAYHVKGEILTALQEKSGFMPRALGHEITLKDPSPLSGLQRLNPDAALRHSVQLHGTGAVIKSMDKWPPW
jgi:Flp pilus assembly pilin Flp